MKEWGYGQGYQHAHQFEDAIVDMECLPPSLDGPAILLPDRTAAWRSASPSAWPRFGRGGRRSRRAGRRICDGR